ncbi:MAG: amidohydrolase family protein [Desulfovibrionaceae bacterium]
MTTTRRIIKAKAAVTLDPDLGSIENAVLIAGGDPPRLLAVGSGPSALKGESGPIQDLGEAVLAPGLVNAHVHAANVRFRGRLLMGRGLPAWIESMLPHLAEPPDPETMADALTGMRRSGVALAADMSDRDGLFLTKAAASADGPEMLYAVQHFGFAPPEDGLPDPEHMRRMREIAPPGSVIPSGHALYSTHPEAMRLAHAWCREHGRSFFMHLAESPEETRLLADGGGELADLFWRWGVLPQDFAPPGLTPTAYAHDLGLLGPGTVAVHCVQLDDADLDLIARSGAVVCLCPRSNAAIGVGRARFEDLHQAGAPLCLGTDGPGSAPDLSIWSELLFLMQNARVELGLEQWLSIASRNGAEALGMGRDYGRLAPGWRAEWSVVPEKILELAGNNLR